MDRLRSLLTGAADWLHSAGGDAGRADGVLAPRSLGEQRPHPARFIIVSGVVLICAIVATTGLLLLNLRDRAIADAGRELQNLSLVLAEQSGRSFLTVEVVQNNLTERLQLGQAGTPAEFRNRAIGAGPHAVLKNTTGAVPQLDALALIGADGTILNSSRDVVQFGTNVAKRDYFQALSADPTLASYISAPLFNRATGRWLIYVVRQIRNAEGQLLGMVTGGIQLRYFEDFYRKVALGENSSLALLRSDGLLLVRYPLAPQRIGKSVAANPLAHKLIASANIGAVRLTSLIDGRDRIFAARRLDNYPVLLSVSTTTAAALANWRSGAIYTVALALLLIVVSGGATAFSARRIALKLRLHNVQLNAALNNMSQGLVMFDRNGDLTVCNQRYTQMYNLSPERLKTCRTLRDILVVRMDVGTFSGDPDQITSRLKEALKQGKSGSHITKLADGRSIKVVNELMTNGGWVSTHEDITQRQEAENELRRVRQFLDTIIENVPVPVVVKDTANLRYTLINRAAEKFFSISRTQMIGRTAHDVYPEKRARIVEQRDMAALHSGLPMLFSEHPVPVTDGPPRRVKSIKVTVRGDDGTPQYLISLLEDVTEKSDGERRIAYLAHHDVLTGLPNRAFFNERLAETIAQSAASGALFAIVCIDLDGFKEVNDIYGHAVGDALLRQFSQRMTALADGAFLARLGGDEFTFIVRDDPQQTYAKALAERLLTAVVDEFESEGYRLHVGMSMGIAVYPTHGTDAKSLMNNADAALYRAKAKGRGSVRFFEPEMGVRLRERLALQEDLRFAADRDELLLHYQPQVRMSGETIGFEALVRWQNPKRGMISPADFIPVAEESGLIIQIGAWVMREACREAASWPSRKQIAVNISPAQFRSGDLPDLVHAILIETGLAPGRLELEITEGVLIDDFSRAVSILRRLKTLGVKIALDDFGTGYSSLSYLHAFPFDKIKIDRTFIADVQHNRHSAAIVRAVIGLGLSLEVPILAEGVETDSQRYYLENEGCDEMQGFLTGRPCPIEAYADRTGRAPAIAAAMSAR